NDELRRGGVLLRLTPQQLRVLRFLAENAGRICIREELRRSVWGDDVVVDFDRSLNVCIAQIRSALNDDSEGSRFIQTVPRRGYRFVAPVERLPEMAAPAPPPVRRSRLWAWPAIGLLTLVAGFLLWRGMTLPHRTMLAVLPFGGQPEEANG